MQRQLLRTRDKFYLDGDDWNADKEESIEVNLVLQLQLRKELVDECAAAIVCGSAGCLVGVGQLL